MKWQVLALRLESDPRTQLLAKVVAALQPLERNFNIFECLDDDVDINHVLDCGPDDYFDADEVFAIVERIAEAAQ